MRKNKSTIIAILMILQLICLDSLFACTNILVSRGASSDGSVMITYAADSSYKHRFLYVPAGNFKPGSKVDLETWQYQKVNEIVSQVEKTYGIVGLMNDHQVAIGETTTGGRAELVNPEGKLDYASLMLLALQRAASAREAIAIIDKLVQEYGYNSSGETFSISDKNEAWMLEIVGKGKGVKGAVWVAARVPDGYITVHANMSRITSFPENDPDNWLFSKDVKSFATEKGFYKPESGKAFSFKDAYHPDLSVVTHRACAARVWSVYRRVCPNTTFSDDFHRGVAGASDYPLFIKPEKKLSVQDVMALMRDHFEGTPYDMTKGPSAGPFGSPYRYKNLVFEFEGESYCWERPISTQQSGFVMISQSRSWLPDAVGGVYWYCPDDSFTGAFMPYYCGIQSLPEVFTNGDHHQFSWESGWWVFNLVSNLTYDKYSRILPDVQKVQQAKEQEFVALLTAVDVAASKLADSNPELLQKYITDFCTSTAINLFEDWQQLAGFIITKHNDGYIADFSKPNAKSKGINYPADFIKRVIAEEGDRLRIPKESK